MARNQSLCKEHNNNANYMDTESDKLVMANVYTVTGHAHLYLRKNFSGFVGNIDNGLTEIIHVDEYNLS